MHVAFVLAGAGTWTGLRAQAIGAGYYTGGGFIESAAGGARKATFGFNLEGVDENGDGIIDQAFVFEGGFFYTWLVGRGQFQYKDPASGVTLHLDHDASYELNPDGSTTDRISAVAEFVGPPLWFKISCLQRIGTDSSRQGTGSVYITVKSEEDAFGNTDDYLSIRVRTGPYADYNNHGVLKGGEIRWHPAE